MKIGWMPPTCFKSLEELERLNPTPTGLDTAGLQEVLFRVYEGGVVAAYESNAVFGYLAYTAKDRHIDILSLYVMDEVRNKGIGTSLLQFLVLCPLTAFNYDVSVVVPEKNLEVLGWLSRRGFLAGKVLKDQFDGQDGIEMTARLKEEPTCPLDKPARSQPQPAE